MEVEREQEWEGEGQTSEEASGWLVLQCRWENRSGSGCLWASRTGRGEEPRMTGVCGLSNRLDGEG